MEPEHTIKPSKFTLDVGQPTFTTILNKINRTPNSISQVKSAAEVWPVARHQRRASTSASNLN